MGGLSRSADGRAVARSGVFHISIIFVGHRVLIADMWRLCMLPLIDPEVSMIV